MMKILSEIREKAGGVLSLALWIPLFFFLRNVLAAAFELVCSPEQFGFDFPTADAFADTVLSRSVGYCVFFIITFAYGFAVRAVVRRDTQLSRLAFSLPLAVLFAAETAIALNVVFLTVRGIQVYGISRGLFACLFAEVVIFCGGLWLFRVFANGKNTNFTALLALVCVCGAIAVLPFAAYFGDFAAQVYLIAVPAFAAAFALDIAFKGLAYKILERAASKFYRTR